MRECLMRSVVRVQTILGLEISAFFPRVPFSLLASRLWVLSNIFASFAWIIRVFLRFCNLRGFLGVGFVHA